MNNHVAADATQTLADILESSCPPDEERLPYVVESTIWETTITPMICAFGAALHRLINKGPEATGCVLRVIFESVYVLGYREGAKQRSGLTFICPEEATDE